jgi:hypothetical protein
MAGERSMVTLWWRTEKNKTSVSTSSGGVCNFSVELGGFGGILRNRQNNYFGGWLIFFFRGGVVEQVGTSYLDRRCDGLLVRMLLLLFWVFIGCFFFIFPDRAGKKGLGDRWFFLSSSFFLFAFWRYHANL